MKKNMYIIVGLLAFALCVATSAFPQENVSRLLKMLEDDSDRFSHSLNTGLDASPLNGTNAEDDINRYVKDFEDSTDRLKERYEDRSFATLAAREVLTRAKTIDQFMRRNRSVVGSTARTDWQTVKNDIGRLAKAYNIKHKW